MILSKTKQRDYTDYDKHTALSAKSQADTCGTSCQHDTAGGERQTPTHTHTEAGCVRQQSQAVIECDRRAVIRCTRINKNWSDPTQQTETHTCTYTHTHKDTLIHTPLCDGAATAGPPSETRRQESCVCPCVFICACLSVSEYICVLWDFYW